jgi:hypothetical protein
MQLSKKAVKADNPQAVFTAGDWTWKVLKTYQVDDAKPYARWLCAVSSPMTYGSDDYGDTYVRDVVLNSRLIEVGGLPPTEQDLQDVEVLVTAIRANSPKDPLRDMEHDFQRSRFAGNWVCSRCGLLPLEPEDVELSCGKDDCGCASCSEFWSRVG